MQDFPQAVEKLLKYHRHDIMNILQVIRSCPAAKKDKLFAYIRKASEEIQQFSRFIGCGDIRFALIVYEELLKEFGHLQPARGKHCALNRKRHPAVIASCACGSSRVPG